MIHIQTFLNGKRIGNAMADSISSLNMGEVEKGHRVDEIKINVTMKSRKELQKLIELLTDDLKFLFKP